MRQSITTKYLGPTNFRGSRIKAIARRRTDTHPELSLTDSWDYGATVEENHARVAKLLAAKLDWSGTFVGGSLDGAGYAFVNIGREVPAPVSYGTPDRDWFHLEGKH